MGVFDFFKKDKNSKPVSKRKPVMMRRSFQLDFVSHLGINLGNSCVVFGENGPGHFSINGEVFTLQNEYVDDIGYSSDRKYRKAATNAHCFWVNPSDFDDFFTCMNKTLQEAIFVTDHSIDFDTYLSQEQTYFERDVRFNITGVSHNFGQNTAKIIASLSPEDPLFLKLATDEEGNANCIKVTDENGHQLGWMPYNLEFPSYEDLELLNQLKAGLVQSAYVVERGQVQGKPYWWCEVCFKLKIPYSRSEEMVYIAPSGSLYHIFPDCKSTATIQIPKSYAEKQMRTLCQRCGKRASK